MRTAARRCLPRSGCTSSMRRIADRIRQVTAVRARSAVPPVRRARPPSPRAAASCSTSRSSSRLAASARPRSSASSASVRSACSSTMRASYRRRACASSTSPVSGCSTAAPASSVQCTSRPAARAAWRGRAAPWCRAGGRSGRRTTPSRPRPRARTGRCRSAGPGSSAGRPGGPGCVRPGDGRQLPAGQRDRLAQRERPAPVRSARRAAVQPGPLQDLAGRRPDMAGRPAQRRRRLGSPGPPRASAAAHRSVTCR